MGVVKSFINKIIKIDNNIDKSLGVTDTELSKKQADIDTAFGIINNIKNEMTNNKSNEVDVLDLVSQTAMARRESERRMLGGGSARRKKYKKGGTQQVHKILEDQNTVARANQLLLHETERLTKYRDFEIILKIMPKLAESIRTYVDNIISPDDFSKKSLNKRYDGDGTKDTNVKLMKNIEDIENRYNLEDKVGHAVEESLTKGDSFIYVSSVSKEMNKLYSSLNEGEDQHVDISNLSYADNSHMFDSSHNITGFLNENVNETSDMIKMMNENAGSGVSIQPEHIPPMINKLVESYTNITDSSNYMFDSVNEAAKDSSGNIKKYFKNVEDVDSNSIFNKDGADFSKLTGSVVKRLDPAKVVKIQADGSGQCYGYYYVDVNYDSSLNDLKGMELPVATSGSSVASGAGNFNASMFFDQKSASAADDAQRSHKRRFIYDIFSERITKGMDSKFINANPQFKTMILDILKTNDILQHSSKLNIIYIPPHQMIHFKDGSGVYGKSVLDDIIVLAKIYMATLMSNIMVRILRGTDKRMWKFEVGLEDDIQEEVDAVIRDVSQRDVNLGTLQDIDYIFNTMGQFDDYVIPTYGGEEPLELEIMDKQDIDLEDPFLEKLEKQIHGTVGVPSSFIDAIEEIELAKSLSMMHQKFLRRVVSKQKAYTKAITKLYRLLYENEYPDDIAAEDVSSSSGARVIKDTDRDMENQFDMSLLFITFPSPASLNMANIIDQFQNADDVVQKIVTTLYGEDDPTFAGEDDPELAEEKYKATKARVKYGLMRKYVTSIDWDDIEKIRKEYTKDIEEEFIEKSNKIKDTDDTEV